MPEKKYLHLLEEDVKVRRWYDNVSRGTQITADVYLRRLGAFCQMHKLTPDSLVSLKDEEIEGIVMDYITSMEKEKFAGSYIKSTIKAVRSWLSFNRKEIKVKLKIKGVDETPSLKDERIPTKEELKKIFLSGDKKARVASALVAHSGLRIEVLGNYTGDDGLTLKDLPEISINEGKVEFSKVPTIVVVRKELSKAGHQYFTFLSEEGCEYVRDYLEERIRKGEKLTSESDIITPKVAKKKFVRAINVGDTIRKAIRKAGFSWRPYVLRSYFDTQLMLAESKGLLLRDYRTFWMGHRGDIENRYTTNRERLPEEVVEDMREAYRKSQEYLQTSKSESTSRRDEFRNQLLFAVGFKQDEIDKMDLTMENEEFNKIIKGKLLGMMTNNGAKQKVVGVNDVEKFIGEGWEFVSPLGNDRAILRIP